MKLTKSGVIAGSKFRYDIPSKAAAVNAIINTPTTTELIASSFGVAEITVKVWVKTYYYSYADYMKLPKGTMQIRDVVISGNKKVKEAKSFVELQQRARHNFNEKTAKRKYKKSPKLTIEDYHKLNGITK